LNFPPGKVLFAAPILAIIFGLISGAIASISRNVCIKTKLFKHLILRNRAALFSVHLRTGNRSISDTFSGNYNPKSLTCNDLSDGISIDVIFPKVRFDKFSVLI
jgi:hypothetical protein